MLQTRSNGNLTKAPRSRVYSGLGALFAWKEDMYAESIISKKPYLYYN